MAKTTWTEAQVDYLVSAYSADTPNTTIAAALGKTRKAVEAKAARLGLTNRRRRDESSSKRLKQAHAGDTKFRRAFAEAVARRKKEAVPKELRALDKKLARCGIPAAERARIIKDETRKHRNAHHQS